MTCTLYRTDVNIATLHKKNQRKSDISIDTFHKAYRTEKEKNHGGQLAAMIIYSDIGLFINSCSSLPRSMPVGGSKQGTPQEQQLQCVRNHSCGTAM